MNTHRHTNISLNTRRFGKRASLAGAIAMIVGGMLAHQSAFAAGPGYSAGSCADATDSSAIAIGNGDATSCTLASGVSSAAIGNGSQAISAGASAFGYNSLASGTNSAAIGGGAKATGSSSSALGTSSQASGSNSLALGSSTKATGDTSIAMGSASMATATSTIAMGTASSASAQNAIAMGVLSNASGMRSMALGYYAGAVAADSLAIGSWASAGAGVRSTAVGTYATTTGFDTVALGANSKAINQASTALGARASTPGYAGVAVGNSASATADYSIAIGQLANSNSYGGVAIGSSTLLYATQATAVGISAQAAESAAALGANAAAGGTNSVAVGLYSRASDENSIALGSYSYTSGRPFGAAYNPGTGVVDNNVFAEMSVGWTDQNRRITHVAAGGEDTDAVNVSQLKSLAQVTADASDRAVKYDLNADGTVNYGSATLEGATSTDGGVTGGSRITNLAQGELSATSTDAVNGSQLYTTNQRVSQNTLDITNLSNSITNINNGVTGLVQQDAGSRNITVAKDTDGTVMDIRGTAGDRTISGVKAGVADNDAVNVSQLNAIAKTAGDASERAVKYDQNADGSTNYNNVSMAGDVSTDGGVTGGSKISNLAQGGLSATSTDAVNGAQLYDTNQRVSQNTTDISNINNNIANINNGSAGLVQQDAASRKITVAKDTDGTVVDMKGTAGDRTVTGVKAGVAKNDAVNVAQLQASEAGGVRYDSNADGSTNYGSVTMNPAGSATTVHNVAAGSATTDAANVGQLNQAINNVQDWSKSYTDRQVQKMGNRAAAGTASAMAQAGLPQAFQPNQTFASAAVSGYGSQAALAVGVSSISKSGRYVLKLSGSTTTTGDVGVTVGAGVALW